MHDQDADDGDGDQQERAHGRQGTAVRVRATVSHHWRFQPLTVGAAHVVAAGH
jgi:hypothetical protein